MCLKFPSSCRQAVWLVLHTACLLWLEMYPRAHTRVVSWLKTFKTLLRHYAKHALTSDCENFADGWFAALVLMPTMLQPPDRAVCGGPGGVWAGH